MASMARTIDVNFAGLDDLKRTLAMQGALNMAWPPRLPQVFRDGTSPPADAWYVPPSTLGEVIEQLRWCHMYDVWCWWFKVEPYPGEPQSAWWCQSAQPGAVPHD